MGRQSRQHQRATGGYYHVMNRGHNREVVFPTEEDHAYFLDLLQRYRQRFAVPLYHYCLMDNHFHLLVERSRPKTSPPGWLACCAPTCITFTAAMASWATCGRDASRARPWRWRCISSVAPLHRAQPRGGGPGGGTLGVPLVQLPRLCPGPTQPPIVVQRLVPGTRSGCRAASAALAGVSAGPRPAGSIGTPWRLAARRRQLPAADAAGRGTPRPKAWSPPSPPARPGRLFSGIL